MSTEADKIRAEIAELEKKLAAATPVPLEERLVKGELTLADAPALARSRYETMLARPGVGPEDPWEEASEAERNRWIDSAKDGIGKALEKRTMADKDARIAELEKAYANLQAAK